MHGHTCRLLPIILIFLSVLWFTGCQEKQTPPNILFIMTDDHALKAISAYNPDLIQTPNIDRIAREGALFQHLFATNSICAPSRASILTGKFSHLNGQKDNHAVFDGSQSTFPKLLQQSGYQTALIGKWHLKSHPTGFDYWSIFPGQGFYYNPDINTMGDTSQVEGYATDLVTDLAIEWFQEKRDANKPFFMFYSHKAPHRNWMPALRHLDTLQNRIFPEPSAFYDKYETRLAAHSQLMHLQEHFFAAYDSKVHTIPLKKRDSTLWKLVYEDRLTAEEKAVWESALEDERQEYISGLQSGKTVQWLNYQRYIRDYLRCVMAVDENVGRMLDYLDEAGLADNTLVVYMSDQGMFLGEHGWFDKRWMYEESIRTPLLIRYPGHISQGQIRPEMAMNIDLAPTLLDYAGVAIPEDIQGESLKPLLSGNRIDDWRKEIYYHYYEFPYMTHVNPHYGIRNARYKLIRLYGHVEGWEFYDLQNDPSEELNSYDKAQYQQEIAAMKKQMAFLQEKYKDFNPEAISGQ